MIGSLSNSIAIRSRHPALRTLTLETLRDAPKHVAAAAIRRLSATVPMSDGMTLCRVLGRYKMFVDNADFGLSPHLMLDGFWEMWVTAAILNTVQSGMVAIDVGANLGYFTLLLADLVGEKGRVLAFEPNPRMMTLLDRSIVLNGFADRVSRFADPLGATDGESVTLVVPVGEPKNAHLSRQPMAEAKDAVGYDLRCRTLDQILGDQHVDFIKIDTEGAERDIWRGMERVVARNHSLTIFMEFTAERYDAPDVFLREFTNAGFALSRIDERDGLVAVSRSDILQAPEHVDQMLALVR
jgi:FkbM family methyltransferase